MYKITKGLILSVSATAGASIISHFALCYQFDFIWSMGWVMGFMTGWIFRAREDRT